jgi:hypothetical protein
MNKLISHLSGSESLHNIDIGLNLQTGDITGAARELEQIAGLRKMKAMEAMDKGETLDVANHLMARADALNKAGRLHQIHAKRSGDPEAFLEAVTLHNMADTSLSLLPSPVEVFVRSNQTSDMEKSARFQLEARALENMQAAIKRRREHSNLMMMRAGRAFQAARRGHRK